MPQFNQDKYVSYQLHIQSQLDIFTHVSVNIQAVYFIQERLQLDEKSFQLGTYILLNVLHLVALYFGNKHFTKYMRHLGFGMGTLDYGAAFSP